MEKRETKNYGTEELMVKSHVELIKKFNKSSVKIFDVGANEGRISAKYGNLINEVHTEIHSFEPNPHLVSLIRENMLKVNFKGKHIIHNHAIGDKEEKKELNIAGHSGVSSFLNSEDFLKNINPSDYSIKEKLLVEIGTLDKIFFALDYNIDLLKIDTEGYELSVLNGAIQLLKAQRISIVNLEFHQARAFVGQPKLWEILRFMDEIDYKIYAFDTLIHIKEQQLYYGDITFLSGKAWNELKFN